MHADVEAVEPPDRVLTVPNVISFVRLCCIPWFLYLLFGLDQRADAAILLAVLGATDWIDGYIARRWHQISTVGKVLDPTADRLMLAVGVLAIAVDNSVPLVIAVLTIARETLVGIMALVFAALGARRIDVTWAGKAGTLAQMVAYPLFLASHSDLFWEGIADELAWIFIVPGLVLAFWSGIGYYPLARRALAEGRIGSTS